MRYLSLVFASVLLVGCAPAPTTEPDVDISQQQATESDSSQTEQSEPESLPEESEAEESEPEEQQTEEDSPESELEAEEQQVETESTEEDEAPSSGENQTEQEEPREEGETEEEPVSEAEEEVSEETEPEETQPTGYTMAMVAENNDASSCWSAINGNVYDLTDWINSHPGGPSRILSLCGTDGSASFNGKHGGQSNPESRLQSYLLGPLS